MTKSLEYIQLFLFSRLNVWRSGEYKYMEAKEVFPVIARSSNTKKFWSVFKSVSRTSNVPSKMVWCQGEHSVTAGEPDDIANLLNEYFHSTFKPSLSEEEYEDHPSTTTIPLSETLSDIHITPDEVKNILLSLDDNKATGPDNIPAKLLRCSAPQICSSLCDLFNLSLKCGKIPAAWKISNVVPIPKKGLLKVVSNYRPISLLSIVSKVFERCVYNRLIAHVDSPSTFIISNSAFSEANQQRPNFYKYYKRSVKSLTRESKPTSSTLTLRRLLIELIIVYL